MFFACIFPCSTTAFSSRFFSALIFGTVFAADTKKIVFVAGPDVPENGIPPAVPTFEELLLTHPKESDLKPEQVERIRKMLDGWKNEF